MEFIYSRGGISVRVIFFRRKATSLLSAHANIEVTFISSSKKGKTNNTELSDVLKLNYNTKGITSFCIFPIINPSCKGYVTSLLKFPSEITLHIVIYK